MASPITAAWKEAVSFRPNTSMSEKRNRPAAAMPENSITSSTSTGMPRMNQT